MSNKYWTGEIAGLQRTQHSWMQIHQVVDSLDCPDVHIQTTRAPAQFELPIAQAKFLSKARCSKCIHYSLGNVQDPQKQSRYYGEII